MGSHKEIILNLLRNNPKVTLRMLFDVGVGYSGRNRIGELRKSGYEIRFTMHKTGEPISDNYYELISEPNLPVKNFKESHPSDALVPNKTNKALPQAGSFGQLSFI